MDDLEPTYQVPTNKEKQPLPELVIRANTADEEFSRLWWTLERTKWYQENGYNPILPDDQQFQEAMRLGVDKTDKENLKDHFVTTIYDPDSYELGIKTLENARTKIEASFPIFQRLHEKWGFVIFPKYEVKLTRYGTGGSYSHAEGSIVTRINPDGTLIRRNPAHHTPIHEITHIGTELPIVKKFGLTHNEKEGLIDAFCMVAFPDLLPDYKLQDRSDRKIIPFITAEAIEHLPQTIAAYVDKYPR